MTTQTPKTLKDVMPEDLARDYVDVPAHKLLKVEVASEHRGHQQRWPGPQKNVHFWVKLTNGKAVGWNENPARGWSFPVITLKD